MCSMLDELKAIEFELSAITTLLRSVLRRVVEWQHSFDGSACVLLQILNYTNNLYFTVMRLVRFCYSWWTLLLLYTQFSAAVSLAVTIPIVPIYLLEISI